MKRFYISTADFQTPYDGAHFLQGLGDEAAPPWPTGRTYWTTAHFRSPYDQGYFQDNTMMGLGTITESVRVVARQIPTWAYVAAGVGLAFVAYKKYKKGS